MLEDEQAKTQEALSGTPKPLSQMNSKDRRIRSMHYPKLHFLDFQHKTGHSPCLMCSDYWKYSLVLADGSDLVEHQGRLTKDNYLFTMAYLLCCHCI